MRGSSPHIVFRRLNTNQILNKLYCRFENFRGSEVLFSNLGTMLSVNLEIGE